MKNLLTRLWREEAGQDLVEYGLLLVLLVLAVLSTMAKMSSSLNNVFSKAASVAGS